MKPGSILFAAAALVASPVAAQTFELECETENTDSLSLLGNQPIRRVTIQMLKVRVDLGAKQALFRTLNDDGTPLTALRDLLVATPTELVLCQADVCQRETVVDGWNSTTSLTTIDLTTGKLSRRVEENKPNPSGGAGGRRTIIRDGMCRRV